MTFNEWLNRPYPLIQGLRSKLVVIFGFGFFVSLFLNIYQPFGASSILENKILYLSGFGISVTLALAVSYLLLPRLLDGFFDPEKWQIKKEILFILISFLIVSVFNYFYNNTIGGSMAPQRSFIEFFGITFSVGIFPVIIMIFIMELLLSRKNNTAAKGLNQLVVRKEQAVDPTMIEVIPETSRSESLKLSLKDFLFARADNNYTTFYFLDSNQLDKALLRISLKNAASQLSEIDSLVRCHKTFIVNKSKIVSLKGNARSLNIQLEGYSDLIPVSRNFPKENLVD